MVNDDVAWTQYDALQSLIVQIVRVHPGFRPADPISSLLEELYTRAVSASGNAELESVTLDSWGSPRDAGAAVGMSDRRVRQLAAAGLIRAKKHGRDWLVDLEDLGRHLRRESA